MTSELLLTIDDSPSADTDRLTGFLAERDVFAILFCRGDRLSQNPDPVIRAIRKGFVIGNHAFSHRRFSSLSFAEGIEEIERTEALIDSAHAAAGVERPGKFFRFPYLDRGCGGWVVDYTVVPQHRDTLSRLFTDGLGSDLEPPDEDMKRQKRQWQAWLRKEGFRSLTVPDETLPPWYRETEMAEAVDCMFTFSTSDWMLTDRHAGKWRHKTIDDLKNKIDRDEWLGRGGVVLAHDQDGLFPVVSGLISHMLDKGLVFSKGVF